MKILIIYSKTNSLQKIVQGIKSGIESNGNDEVDTLNTEINNNKSISFHPYDLVMIGSYTKGFIRGKSSEDLLPLLKKCKGTLGQKTIAFITPRFFATNKALKDLMNKLEEKLGCMIIDFKKIKNKKEGIELGRNLKNYNI